MKDATALPNSASKFWVVIFVSEIASSGGLMTIIPENRILVVGAVQLIRHPAERLAVHLNLLAGLRVFIRCVVPTQRLRAGQQ